jgi:hypothetical protein
MCTVLLLPPGVNSVAINIYIGYYNYVQSAYEFHDEVGIVKTVQGETI